MGIDRGKVMALVGTMKNSVSSQTATPKTEILCLLFIITLLHSPARTVHNHITFIYIVGDHKCRTNSEAATRYGNNNSEWHFHNYPIFVGWDFFLICEWKNQFKQRLHLISCECNYHNKCTLSWVLSSILLGQTQIALFQLFNNIINSLSLFLFQFFPPSSLTFNLSEIPLDHFNHVLAIFLIVSISIMAAHFKHFPKRIANKRSTERSIDHDYSTQRSPR